MQKQYDPDHYRVVFFSSAPIGTPFLQELFDDKRFEVVGVVTQCDKPAGRGMQVCENIIKTATKQCIIGHQEDCDHFVQTPTKIHPEKSEEGKQFAERLQSRKPDFLVVIAYGKIIPQAILDIPTIAPINIHGSLLPKYRGASPLQSVFLNGDEETGITIMKMDATMDTGDMIDTLKFKIPFVWTVKDVIEKMKEVGPKFLCDVVRKYGKKMLGEVKQDNSKATLCGKIEKESGLIYPRKDSLQDIYSKYRGFYLWPKIYFMFNKPTPSPSLPQLCWTEVKEGNIRIIIEEMILNEKLFEENKNKLLIEDGNEMNPCVEKLIVKPEGKKPMEWAAFVNGYLK